MATIEMIALPALDSSQINKLKWTAESDRHSAYVTILEAEAHALRLLGKISALPQAKERGPATKEVEGKLVAIRVAGHLFLEFEAQSGLFGIAPSAVLVKWFTSPPKSTQSNQDDVIIDIGTRLRDSFIQLFRMSNVRYPPPPSPSSFDTLEDMIKDTIESTDHSYSTSKKKVLARDGYRCAVTGLYNRPSFDSCAEMRSLRLFAVVTLEIAHILDESIINPTVDRDHEDFKAYSKTRHAAGATTILESFGFSKLVDAFSESEGVHHVWNLISLQFDVCYFFNHLRLWFEHTGEPHCYKVCTSNEIVERSVQHLHMGPDRPVDGAPMFVEFNSRYEEAPPPNPLLLALHATCARVANMSGAAQFFDLVEEDAEETMFLTSDGSSGPLLSHLLSPFAVVPGVG